MHPGHTRSSSLEHGAACSEDTATRYARSFFILRCGGSSCMPACAVVELHLRRETLLLLSLLLSKVAASALLLLLLLLLL